MLNIAISIIICLILYPYVSNGADAFIEDMAYITKVAVYYAVLLYITIIKRLRAWRNR